MIYLLAKTFRTARAMALICNWRNDDFLYVAEPHSLNGMRWNNEADRIVVAPDWFKMNTSQELRRKHEIYLRLERMANMHFTQLEQKGYVEYA